MCTRLYYRLRLGILLLPFPKGVDSFSLGDKECMVKEKYVPCEGMVSGSLWGKYICSQTVNIEQGRS